MRKVHLRILPLIFVLYLVAYLDRSNVAFAKLAMSADLDFSDAVFGFGAGVFFIGYLLLEIPGALIVERWGARWWFARILVTWGICTVLVGLVETARQFYVTRFLLGVAEAGFFPGAIIYLNQWFPSQYRGRAMARFIMATPIALTIGAPISGLILGLDWLGLPGWRWVFILEALPAIVLGVLVPFIMTDRPHQAGWLSSEERDWLCHELDKERKQKQSIGRVTIWQALRQRNVLVLAMMTFFANVGIQGFFLWLPESVHKASGLSAFVSTTVSGLPFAVAVVSLLFFSWSSDRTQERYWHTALPLIVAGCLFPITTLPSLSFGWFLFWLCASSFALYGFGPSYWVLPTLTLSESAAAAAVGFINCFSGLGGFFGPTVIGWMLSSRVPFQGAVFLIALTFLISGGLTFALKPLRSPRRLESNRPARLTGNERT